MIYDILFVGADAMILVNVRIYNNVKIGAGAIVVQDVLDNCIVVGYKATIGKR